MYLCGVFWGGKGGFLRGGGGGLFYEEKVVGGVLGGLDGKVLVK